MDESFICFMKVTVECICLFPYAPVYLNKTPMSMPQMVRGVIFYDLLYLLVSEQMITIKVTLYLFGTLLNLM